MVERTCGGEDTLSHLLGAHEKDDMAYPLQICCGAAPGFSPPNLENFRSSGSVTWGNYTDSQCSSADTGAVAWDRSTLMTANPTTLTLGACLDAGYWEMGYYFQFQTCNGTDGSATGAKEYVLLGLYLDASCTHYAGQHMIEMGCLAVDKKKRRLEGGNATKSDSPSSGGVYNKWSCAASVPSTKQFATTLSVDFGGLAGLSTEQLTAVKDAYEPKALTTFKTALGNEAATVEATHTYTGALAARRRRRLSALKNRRLSATGGVSSTFVATLPAAAAATAQAAIVTATTGNTAALTATAFKSTIETELASNTATSSFASNITAVVTAPIVTTLQPVAAPASTPSSTSGAATNVLGLFSVLVVAVFAF